MYNPNELCEFQPFCARAPIASHVRLLHASPDAPAVDVYSNGNLIVGNLPYSKFTQYFPVAPGTYNIQIFPAGKKTNPVLNTSVTVPPKSILTVAAAGKANELGLVIIPDTPMPAPTDKANIRFVHLSPNAPNVDITLPDGTVLFKDVEFEEITNYIPVNPAKYTLQARIAGTDQVVLTVPNINLKPGKFYTVYAIGLAGGKPPLQVLIPLDGNTYIKI